uniref:Uncharacterized protein n=1 Tax=Meloidogyne hapla TaxID=6305 RepID=A0A1I8BF06_MELHA
MPNQQQPLRPRNEGGYGCPPLYPRPYTYFDKKEEYEEFIGMVKTDSEVIKNCKK